MPIIFTNECPGCGRIRPITATKEQIDAFYAPNRPHIQNIFPELSAADREGLITGYCDPCWVSLYANPEED